MASYKHQLHNACGAREGGGLYSPLPHRTATAKDSQHTQTQSNTVVVHERCDQCHRRPSTVHPHSLLVTMTTESLHPYSFSVESSGGRLSSPKGETLGLQVQGIPRVERMRRGVLTLLVSHAPIRSQVGLPAFFCVIFSNINPHIQQSHYYTNNLQILDQHVP